MPFTGFLDAGRERPPLVSIVIVSYNYARYLRQAVESALAQNYSPIEVIAVDDGSTDGSQELLQEFVDRVSLVLKANGGETSAVNAGFAHSRGEIVLFLDSDDVLGINVVEEVVSAWRPNTAKAQWRVDVIDGEGNSRHRSFPAYPPNFSAENVSELVLGGGAYPSPPTSGNAYSRSFLSCALPLDTTLFAFAPDAALNTIAPLYGEVVTIDQALSFYRIHGHNMWAMTTLDAERILDDIALARKQADFLGMHAISLGIRLSSGDPLDHSLLWLERRLAALKLMPGHPLVARDRSLVLFRSACRCAVWYERGHARAMLKLAWFLATAISPQFLARRLLRYRFADNALPSLLRAIWRVSRLAAAAPLVWY